MFKIKPPIVLLVLPLVWSAASADVAVLEPARDTVLFQEADEELSNGQGPHLFSGRIATGQARRSLLAFDLSSIPSGSEINGAVLRLEQTRTVSPALTIAVHRLLTPWGEGASNSGSPGGRGDLAQTGDATWRFSRFPSVAWANEGGDFAPQESASERFFDNGSYEIAGQGLVADVQLWLESPGQNFGWILVGNEAAGSGTARRFESRESLNSMARPRLIVDFVPPAGLANAVAVPTGGWLWASLLIATLLSFGFARLQRDASPV